MCPSRAESHKYSLHFKKESPSSAAPVARLVDAVRKWKVKQAHICTRESFKRLSVCIDVHQRALFQNNYTETTEMERKGLTGHVAAVSLMHKVN